MVFYESPYRVVKCLEQFAEVFGSERRVSVSRELTKKFEQTVRGTVAEVLEHFRTTEPKGEFVIVLAGKPKPKRNYRMRRLNKGLENGKQQRYASDQTLFLGMAGRDA